MKRIDPLLSILTIVFLWIYQDVPIWSQGKVMENESFYSPALDMQSHYSIYLPDSLTQKDKVYPVIYLLHGFSGNHTDWIRQGDIINQVRKAITEGKIKPCIIVMPDGKNSWYVNSALYGHFEDMIIQDLITHIESRYGQPGKEGRAIIGLSMGGYAAFSLSMKYTHLFGSCVALSGSFWSDGYYSQFREQDIPYLFSDVYGPSPLTSELWRKNNPFYFMHDQNTDSYNSVRILFDCGDDDRVVYSQLVLSNFLREKKVNHELRIRNGLHDWNYWKSHITEALVFCSEGFVPG